MTVTNIPSPEDNPFFLIKVRHIFGWYFLFGIGIYIQIGMIGSTRGIPFDGKTPLDPLVEAILGIYLSILILALVWRQCRLAGIEIKYLVGKVPDRYQWFPLVGLASAHVLFSIGAFYLFYYPLSFIVPSFVEKILTDNINKSILITASKTFAPAMYYLIVAIYRCAIEPIFSAFIITAIMLHRWATKWGNIPAVIALCLFFSAGFLAPNFIYIISAVLIYVILYAKTRSLLVVIIFIALESIISTSWGLLSAIFFDNQTGSTLDIFRSEVQRGVLYFVVSAPWVIGFMYKNWSVLKWSLPYFANAWEAEKIKADSET